MRIFRKMLLTTEVNDCKIRMNNYSNTPGMENK